MKTFFKTAGVILAAGAILAACGSSSTSAGIPKTPKPKSTTVTYGWSVKVNSKTKLQTLTLPYVGVATPAITKFASTDPTFYAQIINPKDWRYSSTFGQHIFVGPYTNGEEYWHIRDAKVDAQIASGVTSGNVLESIAESPVGLITHAISHSSSEPAVPGICIPPISTLSSKKNSAIFLPYTGVSSYYAVYNDLKPHAQNATVIFQNVANCTAMT